MTKGQYYKALTVLPFLLFNYKIRTNYKLRVPLSLFWESNTHILYYYII